MSERKGLQVVAGLLLAVAGVFACYLASQAVELYQLFASWSAKENYVHDVYNVCKLFLWVLGVYWCYTTFCSGLYLCQQRIESVTKTRCGPGHCARSESRDWRGS